MPTIEINLRDLQNLLKTDLKEFDLEELFSYVKGEIEEKVGTVLKLELKDTNRPDLWSVEGIARSLKGILEIEKGLPSYKINKSGYRILVDPSVLEIRPIIVSAVVKNVKMDEDVLSSLIQLQDKVMDSYGRKRRKIAIGTSNLDLIRFPVTYKAVDPESISFEPLYGNKKMTLKEILEETEKGKKYGYILKNFDKYPILIDARGEVISFPPIINSNKIGRIDVNTKNIFIDVTGTDLESCLTALNVIVTSLADRGGKIYSVEIVYPDKTIVTPDLSPKEIMVDPEYIRKLSGVNFTNKELIDLLKRNRFDAKFNEEGKIVVKYLPYRNDIFSQRDIVEDILIAYGFNLISPRKVRIPTVGKELEIKRFIDGLREILIGIGGVETYNPVISSKKVQTFYNILEVDLIEIENPVSINYNVVRWSIIPQLLEVLSKNKDYELPQEIFEIGETVEVEDEIIKERYKLGYAYTNYISTFSDIKSRLEPLFINLGLKYSLEEFDYSFLIPGRSANIIVNGEIIGYIGEIHPKILTLFGIPNPVSIFEINVNKLFDIYRKEIKKK